MLRPRASPTSATAGSRSSRLLLLVAAVACGGDPSEPTRDPATEAPSPDAGASSPAPPAPVDLDALGLSALRPTPRLSWPTRPVHITSTFGWRVDPVSGKGTRLHKGIDLRGAIGDLAMSIGDGTVHFAGHDPLLGNLVVVDHDAGLQSWYGHLSAILVHEGLRVDRGAAIGLVGNTGRSAAPHLHLTIKLDGEAIDPLRLLGQPPHAPRGLRLPPEPEGSTGAQDGLEDGLGVGTGGTGEVQPPAVEPKQ